jgi:hypothetical protein
MPTKPEALSQSVAAARKEAGQWAGVADAAGSLGGAIVPAPLESEVVRFFDPADDLTRRSRRWGHVLVDHSLESLARFAAGLAVAEAESWASDQPDVAVRAFSDRRHLAGDRVLHWAVPWLYAVGQSSLPAASRAMEAAVVLLEIGDRLRPAPSAAAGAEGLHPPGEDSYGPLDPDLSLTDLARSVWSGAVLLGIDAETEEHYLGMAATWGQLAEHHDGAAALWMDLAARAGGFAARLGGNRNS